MAEGGKSFNSIDNKDQLMLVEIKDGKFGGFKQDLLLGTLSKIEMKVCICIGCNGLGRNACNVGEEQHLMCENCIPEGSNHIPLKVARDELPFISAKCPLNTRGCVWKDVIGTLYEHLEECEYFVVNCSNNCQMILQRMELENHLMNDCTHRNVICEHCNGTVLFKDLTSHHETCPEFPLLCGNECGGTFKRKEMQAHVDTDCPNTVMACEFKVFGCGAEMKRCELAEHLNANQLVHLDFIKNHAKIKFESIDSAVKQLNEEKIGNNQLTELQQKLNELVNKLEERQNENTTLTAENATLKTEVEALKKGQTDTNTQIETSKKAHTELENKSKEFEAKLAERQKENTTLTAENTKLKTEVEALKKAQTDTNTQIETSKKAHSELENKSKEFEAKLTERLKENTTLTAENATLKTEVEALKKAQTDTNTQIETSKKAHSELENKSKEFETKLAERQKENTTLTAGNATLKTEVEALKKAQTDLKTQFEAFKKEILEKIPKPAQ